MTSTNTPGAILADLIRNRGIYEFTVEPLEPGERPSHGCVDLTNGNQLSFFVSHTTDGVYGSPGSGVDLAACNFGDWVNLSSSYTGQHGAPDSMHDSEFVGGLLSEDMAATPGEYALPYVTWYCDDECECGGDGVLPGGDYCELDIEGWLVLYRDIFTEEGAA